MTDVNQMLRLRPVQIYSVVCTDAFGQTNITHSLMSHTAALTLAERLQLEPAAVANGWVYTVQEHNLHT
jgi:hypothetical protein